MGSEFITLQCPNCGARLEIAGDMEHFACGYCGSEVVVQRRGGTVGLKLVKDAIERVQRGTDRSASELTLVRLEREINALLKEGKTLQGDAVVAGCLGGGGAFVALFIALLCMAGEATVAAVVFAGIGVVALVALVQTSGGRSRKREAVDEQVRAKNDEMATIKALFR